jgi:hypothetical protein
MRCLPVFLSFTLSGAAVPVNLADYRSGTVIQTDSEFLDSDPRDAIGGTFSRTEAGNLIFADKVQEQRLVIRFPAVCEVASIVLEVVPGDPARMPEQVVIAASANADGPDWQQISSDPHPAGSPLVYDAFEAVRARRVELDFGVSQDARGARIREVKIFGVEREALYPQLEPPPHWVSRPHPGRVSLDAWGWEAPITYQRSYRGGVGFDYFQGEVIDESYRWGANLLDVYPPYFFPTSWPFEWSPDSVFERPESYPQWNDPRWQAGTLRALSRYAHSKGMLVQWFCHPELVPGKRGEATFTDAGKISQNLTALRKLGFDYSNAVRDPWEDLFDGFGHEHWFDDQTGRTAHAGWEWNPGMYFYSTSNWRPFAEPSYSKSLMCAGSWDLRGRDDQWLLPLEKGVVPLSIQADSRTLQAPRETWGGWSRFGGGTYPDWILKQVNDFFRRRFMAKERPDATAIWWLGEPNSVLPTQYRSYVYGISQDPMRCAVAAQLRTTGVMGHMDMMNQFGNPNIGRRYSLPATTHFIQNNYLRLYRDATSDRTILVYDPTRTAHFDGDSDGMVVSSDLLQVDTGAPQEPTTVWQLGHPDGSSAEFRPRFAMLAAQSTPHDPAKYSAEGQTVVSVGEWDGASSELLPEGDFREGYVVDIRETTTNEFPGLFATPPRGPKEITLRLHAQAGTYRLELGQQNTAVADQVFVLVDGSPVGRLQTLDTDALKKEGLSHAVHLLAPIEIPRDGLHELTLSLMGGDGFEVDALRLVYTGPVPPALSHPEPYGSDEFVYAGVTRDGQMPAGVGRVPYALPVDLHILSALEPGTYRLRVGFTGEPTPTYVQAHLGSQFIGAHVSQEAATEAEIPFCVLAPGDHDLRITAVDGAGCGFDFLLLERLSRMRRSFEILEPAGHLAVLKETLVAPTPNGTIVETRRFALVSDTPLLRIDIDRSGPGAKTLFCADGYETILPIVREGNRDHDDEPLPMEVLWSEGDLPELMLRLVGVTTAMTGGNWLELDSPAGGKFEGLLVMLDGLYEMEQVLEIPYSREVAPQRHLGTPTGLVEKNPSRVPEVRVVRIMNPAGSPYFVEEEAPSGSRRWYFRGAEPSREIPGTDLLKVYLPGGGRARIIPDGLIDGIARPGWGCQYIMALGDLAQIDTQISLTVDVFSMTPFIFSPRVQVSGPVRHVLLDGRPYRYFDGDVVFLPNRRGKYRLDVSLGRPDQPHLVRTCGVVKEAQWDESKRVLLVEAELPEWCPELRPELDLAALIDLEGGKVAKLSGGKVEREEQGQALVWYRESFELEVE